MAIKLEVKEYCANCLDFESDVTKPERAAVWSFAPGSPTTVQTDTIVRCRHASRCANLVRYLNRQNTEGN